MTTKHYTNAGTSTEIVDRGSFFKVQIGREWSCATEDDIQFEPILTFEQHFYSSDNAKAFMTTKLFKATFRAIEKTQAAQHTK